MAPQGIDDRTDHAPISFDAITVDSGHGELPSQCPKASTLGYANDSLGENTWYLLESPERDMTCIDFPARGLRLKKGDAVTVEYQWAITAVAGEFFRSLQISRADTSIVAWYGEGHQLMDLSPPLGMSFTDGGAACILERCPEESIHTLNVEHDGESVRIGPGETSSIAGYEIAHLGLWASDVSYSANPPNDTSRNWQCDDYGDIVPWSWTKVAIIQPDL